ncbi:MAG TPA: DUF998 domain-containing protein [Pilimelia sp.]|nr:DUF998 domain-containing protein [Pilimelia sp.]
MSVLTEPSITTGPTTCDRPTSVTRSLLAYGVIAGPCYVAVSLGQALTRDGFDLTRHAWSMLANGPWGWLQVVNFVLTGLMTVALAAGLRRALRRGPAGTWAPRLVAAYGVSLVAAGAFRADPGLGFPAGTPAGPGDVSWHGTLHFVAGAIGFTCLAVACFVLAARFAADGRRGWAAYSRLTGALFLASFVAVSAAGGAAWGTLSFTAGMLLVWAWVSAVAAHLYGRVTRTRA